MSQVLRKDNRGREYFLEEILTDKIVNSRHNPRQLKSSHKNELKKSIEDRGQLVPIIGHMTREDSEKRANVIAPQGEQ